MIERSMACWNNNHISWQQFGRNFTSDNQSVLFPVCAVVKICISVHHFALLGDGEKKKSEMPNAAEGI